MFHLFTSSEAWVSLITLVALEIVLGIDNLVFLSILVGRLPPTERARARLVGLGLAFFGRVGLLFSLSAIMRLTAPLVSVSSHELSGRDFILLGGGLFLLYKATSEIFHQVEGKADVVHSKPAARFWPVIAQIALVDAVFSLDSVITAVGMTDTLAIMVAAVAVASASMLLFAKAIGDFIERHPSVKLLGLAFLLMVGVVLAAEAFDHHISKGYVYFAMGFAFFVELLNIHRRRHGEAATRSLPL